MQNLYLQSCQTLIYENVLQQQILSEKFSDTVPGVYISGAIKEFSSKINKHKKTYQEYKKKEAKLLKDTRINKDTIKNKIYSIIKKNNPELKKAIAATDIQATNKILSKTTTEIKYTLSKDLKGIFSDISSQEAWLKSFGIFIMMMIAGLIIINFLALFLLPFFGSSTMYLLSILIPVLVAPIVEEAGKYMSIKQNSSGSFFIVFNAIEFTQYVVGMINMGVNPLTAIIARLISMSIHLGTTMVQYRGLNQANDIKDKIEADKKRKVTYVKAVLIHGLWNTIAVTPAILSRM